MKHLLEFCNTQHQKDIIEALLIEGSQDKAAARLGISRSTLRNQVRVIEARAAQRGSSPAHDMTRTVPEGYKVKGVSSLYNKEGKLSAQWVKSDVDRDQQVEIMRRVVAAMCEGLPKVAPSDVPLGISADLCNLYTFTDYHLGMMAWHKQGGATWNLPVAEAMLWDSFKRMVDASPAAATAVLNIQGDFLHSDGLVPVTPAHKHVLDASGQFAEIVDAAIRVLRRLISYALAKHTRVHLIIVEGNHDEASSMWLRKMFAAIYEYESRLTVNDSELPYYVHVHGDVMLAFHHGHKVKNEQLPLLFASQFPREWGASKFRHAHCGHRHHLDEKEYAGMVVTQHPTISARDAYAARGGWISERAAIGITYHARAGQYGRTYVTPELLDT